MKRGNRVPDELACLTDPSRYRILSVLIEGDFCVTEIAARVGLSQSCTTRHLQVMQRARVLTRTRLGKRVLFRVREGDPELERLLELVTLLRPLHSEASPPSRPAVVPRARAPKVWVPRAHRRPVTGTGGPASNTIPLSIPRSGDEVSVPPAVPASPADSARAVEDEAESVPAGATTDLEDYLL